MFGNYLVSGTIIIQNKIIFENAILYINLVDSTYCDISSNIIYSYILENINKHIKNTNEIKFSFDIKKELIKPNKEYSLEVHIDVNNDKKISNGDYINIQNYPLSMFITSNKNLINLKLIN